jgi:hypothetical protein
MAEQLGDMSKWTPSQRELFDYVDGLALMPGGKTEDVVRVGAEILWPGKTLIGEVINISPHLIAGILAKRGYDFYVNFPEDLPFLYGLTVVDDEGEEVESLTLDGADGSVTATIEQTDIFDGKNAPDYMIKSFFARWHLNHGPMHENKKPALG